MEIGLVPDFDIDFPACSFLHFPFHVWQVLLAKLIKLYIPGFERLQHPDSVKCLGCSSEFPARWLNRIRTRQHMHDRISWVKGRELMWQLLAGYPDLCWCDDSLLLMALESCYPSIKWIQKDPKGLTWINILPGAGTHWMCSYWSTTCICCCCMGPMVLSKRYTRSGEFGFGWFLMKVAVISFSMVLSGAS